MNLIALIAALSGIAAIFSALAAWRMPVSAAKLAEAMRSQNERRTQERQFQLNVFAEIMQGRAEIYSEYTVRALNSIDIAFHKSARVREAWAELYQALHGETTVDHVIEERMRKLLREMAEELGLAENLRLDDFARVYFPTALAEDRHIKLLQRKDSMKRLMGHTDNQSPEKSGAAKWPPKPNDQTPNGK